MYHPEEIIFAPTARCNLVCGHCRVTRIADELDPALAIAFLDSCLDRGIERIGFSGGEPFLRPDFLYAVSRAAVERGYLFDRLMTNGLWAADEAGYRKVLEPLCAAGFDGKFGLSFDAWHGNAVDRAAIFLTTAFTIWGRQDIAEIITIDDPRHQCDDPRHQHDDPRFADQNLVKQQQLAARLGGSLQSSGSSTGYRAAIVDAVWLARDQSTPDDGSGLHVPVLHFPYSAPVEGHPWDATDWFEDDCCAGPGNVFYVHPDGRVAVCCGHANEHADLIIGSIQEDDYDALMANAARMPRVRQAFETGLGSIARRMAAAGTGLPGRTDDMCRFCAYLCQTSAD
jgi:hypothetical protein